MFRLIPTTSSPRWISPCTLNPDAAWVAQQTRNFLMHAADVALSPKLVMHDRDTKFTAKFDASLKANGQRVMKSAYRSPNTLAFVERFIQTLGQECLDFFVVFGTGHLGSLCSVFVEHYHRRRLHQGKDNELLVTRKKRKSRKPPRPQPAPRLTEIGCETQLGGLLRYYYRKAA